MYDGAEVSNSRCAAVAVRLSPSGISIWRGKLIKCRVDSCRHASSLAAP